MRLWLLLTAVLLSLGTPYAPASIRPEDPVNYRLRPGVKLDRANLLLDQSDSRFASSDFLIGPDEGIRLDVRLAEPSDDAAILANEGRVEEAVVGQVERDPAKFGVSTRVSNPSDRTRDKMAPVHTRFLPGSDGRADAFISVFRRWVLGQDFDGKPYYLAVDNANMRFHSKVLDSGTTIKAQQTDANFAEDIDPGIMTVRFSEEELARRAEERLRTPQESSDEPGFPNAAVDSSQEDPIVPLTRMLIKIGPENERRWRAVNVYRGSDLQGQALIVVVDVNTGESWAFASQAFRDWSGRGVRTGLNLLRATLASLPDQKPPEAALLPLAAASGTGAQGEVFTKTDLLTNRGFGNDHGPIEKTPLIGAKIKDLRGNVVAVVGADGSFTIPVDESLPESERTRSITVEVELDTIFGRVIDAEPGTNPLKAQLTVTPGSAVKATAAMIDPGDDPKALADTTTVVYSNRLFAWFKDYLKLGDPRLHTKLVGDFHTNGKDAIGNAYYNPVVDGFFTMKSATMRQRVQGRDGNPMLVEITFENTAQPSIILHELGHRFVQMASQIRLTAEQREDPKYRFVRHLLDPVMESAVNEAIADIISMLFRKSSLIGNGFIVKVDPPQPGMRTEIRNGKNSTQVNPQDGRQRRDPHLRGEPLMGFVWDVYEELAREMGPEEAQLAVALMAIPTLLYVQPGDVASAIQHIILAAMAKDGQTRHESLLHEKANDRRVPPPGEPLQPRISLRPGQS